MKYSRLLRFAAPLIILLAGGGYAYHRHHLLLVSVELKQIEGKITDLTSRAADTKAGAASVIFIEGKRGDYSFPPWLDKREDIYKQLKIYDQVSLLADVKSGKRWIWQISKNGEMLLDQATTTANGEASLRFSTILICMATCAASHLAYTILGKGFSPSLFTPHRSNPIPISPDKLLGVQVCPHCFKRIMLGPQGECPACGEWFNHPPKSTHVAETLIWLSGERLPNKICLRCCITTDEVTTLEATYQSEASPTGNKVLSGAALLAFFVPGLRSMVNLASNTQSSDSHGKTYSRVNTKCIASCCRRCQLTDPPKVFTVDTQQHLLGVLVPKKYLDKLPES